MDFNNFNIFTYTEEFKGEAYSIESFLKVHIDPAFFEYLKSTPNIWLGGGSILTILSNSFLNKQQDLDFYFYSNKQIAEFIESLRLAKYHEGFSTPNAQVFNKFNCAPIQVIINSQFFTTLSVYDLLGHFDFYNCMCAYNFHLGNLIYNKNLSLEVFRNKMLLYNPNCHTPQNAYMRLRKYIGKGYKIDKYNLHLLYLKLQSLRFEKRKLPKNYKSHLRTLENIINTGILDQDGFELSKLGELDYT